jgi:hypothetical protein
MTRLARRRLRRKGLPFNLIRTYAQTLPFLPECFGRMALSRAVSHGWQNRD